MNDLPNTLGVGSYAAAAAAYVALLGFVLPSHPGTRQATAFIAALAVSVLWAAGIAIGVYSAGGFQSWMLIADAARSTAWIAFIAWLLRSRAESNQQLRLGALLLLAALVVFAAVAGLLAVNGDAALARDGQYGQLLRLALLALPLIGVLGLEQLFRNAIFEQRVVLKPLCVGVGLFFAVDVFVFSQSLLLAHVSEPIWFLRGIANVASAPILLLAVKRQPEWGHGVFVSRQVVFYTTTLVAAGLYLLAMGVGGYLISATGATWGPPLQILFFLSAGAVLFYALFAASFRQRLKVFLAKHFYRNRYDYREEWLRLIQTLAGGHDQASLPERSVKALAEIIGSPRGELWLAERGGQTYEPHGAWRMPDPERGLDHDDALVRFLDATHWVVDTVEYRDDPEKYSNALAANPACVAGSAIIVPLIHAGALAGLVRLERPQALPALSYEDHDLLKTAGQQVAIFLEQERAQEQLSETRQFEAFSRLTAFLMHDLKNLIAQQELVVGNAQRFKHRPEFIEDAIRTIESGVQRMRKVLERLQSADPHDNTSLVAVEKVLQDVCAACSDRAPVPQLSSAAAGVRVAIDREKLSAAVTHAIRNAQDATAADGRIQVRLRADGSHAIIEVEDDGAGMDAEFLRNRLFKPFHTTKGAKGMGIGAYQIRETLRGARGDVDVTSEVGHGTTLRMVLPLADAVSIQQTAA